MKRNTDPMMLNSEELENVEAGLEINVFAAEGTEQSDVEEAEILDAEDDGHTGWNVFDEIRATGNDENFIPAVTDEFCPTDAPAGTPAKVEVLAERVRKGLPLWHPEDRVSYVGLIGAHGRSFRD